MKTSALHLALAATLGAALASRAAAQQPTPAAAPAVAAAWDSAARAWDAGDYPRALEALERLAERADAGALRDSIALLTGELYRVRELTTDGRNVQWSADGRYASYETAGAPVRRVTILAVAGDTLRPAATVEGFSLAFSSDGRSAAYLALADTPELRQARAALDRALAQMDFAAARTQMRTIANAERTQSVLRVRDLASGRERTYPTPGLAKIALAGLESGTVYLAATGAEGNAAGAASEVYAVTERGPRLVTSGPGQKAAAMLVGGRWLVYPESDSSFVVQQIDEASAAAAAKRSFGIARDQRPRVTRAGTAARTAAATALTWAGRDGAAYTLNVLSLQPGTALASAEPRVVLRRDYRLGTPSLSPDGRRLAYVGTPREDSELFIVEVDGGAAAAAAAERRLTHEVQNDLLPQWLSNDRLLAVMGESRHRRAQLYDLTTGTRTRLFHNNTVRTVAPEYEWVPSPDGTRVLIVAERDGDTISPERGAYLVDLRAKVGAPELAARVRAQLAAERELRERGRAMFAPIEAAVRAAVRDVSVAHIDGYARDLYAFESKYITQPGNARAIEYLAARLREFGYEPELQWFEPEAGVRTANVVATLPGTENPELVYVVSSHFDSVEEGPGSDDNTSGTTALLEAARVLRSRPQPATIKFAFFTGEEAGLLGSQEFVRRAVAAKDRIVGALNNDMVGFANDHRLDNTVRYSNAGLRDLQHAAAFLFTDLITYDAKYYKFTDAHSYYAAYGDIVGGIGSYPILANPHYHQSHDVLETVNQQLVTEVSRTTVASLMLMASSPSRIAGLELSPAGGAATARWTPAPERGVREYVVTWGPAAEPAARTMTVTEPRATLAGWAPGMVVRVRAVAARGTTGWDWARTGASAPGGAQ